MLLCQTIFSEEVPLPLPPAPLYRGEMGNDRAAAAEAEADDDDDNKKKMRGVGSFYNHLMMFVWLGIIHLVLVLVGVAVYFLPHPAAVSTLAALVVLSFTPNKAPYPKWGMSIAGAITRAAAHYFPLSMEWEDEAAYLAAAEKGTPTVIGLEPHSVLPLSIISFGNYFFFTKSTPQCVRTRARSPRHHLRLPTAAPAVDLAGDGPHLQDEDAQALGTEEDGAHNPGRRGGVLGDETRG